MPERLLPTSIRARVHEDAITRVTRFFDATTVETLNELFQNARRAGATRVDVRFTADKVHVTDDGCGIHDPAALLAFGRSGWNQETARREDPAGMGVYSLARRPQTIVRSRPRRIGTAQVPAWQVRLTPKHFLGEEMASIELLETDKLEFGTEIVFEDTKANEGHVNVAAYHFPLPATCNGKEVKRSDFLSDAVHVEEWRGIRLGVHRSRYHGTRNPEVNFHGIVIENVHLPQISSMTHGWHVRADVIDCAELELVLPARRAVVETPFVEQLRDACRGAIYRAMLASDPQVDVSASVREDALKHGVQLPIARAELAPWKPACANDYYTHAEKPQRRPLPDDAIVVETDMATCDQQALWRAAQQAGIAHRLCAEENRYLGYPWYDRLAKATKLTTTIVLDGEKEHIELRRSRQDMLGNARPQEITFTLEITEGNGSGEDLRIPADVAFPDDETDWAEDVATLVTADSEIAPNELAELIYDGFFSPSDDCEADSYDTQRERYHQGALANALEVLASAEEAMLSNVRNAVDTHVIPYLRTGSGATIRIRAGKPTEIEIEPGDSDQAAG